MRIQHLNVVLISYAVCAPDDCAGQDDIKGKGCKKEPVECFECRSPALGKNNHCADPFNKTHIDIRVKTCIGACAKWVKRPKDGPVSYVRTCSANLDMRMAVSHVCMEESRPGDGRLCFCQKDHCNHGSSIHSISNQLPIFLLSLLTLFVVPHLINRASSSSDCAVTSEAPSVDRVIRVTDSHRGYLVRYCHHDIKDINTG